MNSEIKHNGSATYALDYHLLLVTERHRALLTDEIVERISELASGLEEEYSVTIQTVAEASNHLHVRFSAAPTTALSEFIDALKAITTRKISMEYPAVEKALEKELWQSGYYLTTTGQVSLNELLTYVEQGD